MTIAHLSRGHNTDYKGLSVSNEWKSSFIRGEDSTSGKSYPAKWDVACIQMTQHVAFKFCKSPLDTKDLYDIIPLQKRFIYNENIMTRVLLTGGSGFIAAHTLDILLERGHSVVTTVRTQEKADKIKAQYNGKYEDKLSFAIVPDIAQEGAFDEAVKSDPPFEAVLHTASPFHFNVTDVQKVSSFGATRGVSIIADSCRI